MSGRNDGGTLTAEGVRALGFHASVFTDGENGSFTQLYCCKERPEIGVVVAGEHGSPTVRTIFVEQQEFPDSEFQAVADAYNAMIAQREKSDGNL